MAVDRFKDADPETERNRESNCGNDIKETKQLHMDTTNWKSDLAAYAKMKILIVDDEPANVALLEDMLGEQGYTHLKSTTDSRRVLELKVGVARSEEHTSELQSRENLVC